MLRLLRIGVRRPRIKAALTNIIVRGRPASMHKRKKRHHSRNQSGVTVLEREARIDLAKRPADGLGVAFLGASGTVTGSRYLVDDGETCLLYTSPSPRDS